MRMPFRLLHHDLISVPLGHRRPGIFWLRLYHGDTGHIAVVSEVPGNPSLSVTNGISQIAYYIETEFQLEAGRLVLYEIWPSGSPTGDQPTIHRVQFGQGPAWQDATRDDIEALIGAALPELPDHAELYQRVLSLGGGVTTEIIRPLFEALPVDQLPPPHNPSRCTHIDRFRQIADQHDTPDAQGRWLEHDLEIGRMFLKTLTPDDLHDCPFHNADWRAIADASVRIIETLGRRDTDEYASAASDVRLRRSDREWLVSLFSDPIFIGGGAYTNGQHRGCALRFSGAKRAAIATDDEILGEECTDWTYRGGG